MSPYRTSRLIALVVGAALPFFLASGAGADDAEVLPKGVSNAYLGNFFYPFPTTDRFNKHGDEEPIANVFDNRRLDSTVFPTLLPPGQNIGTSFIKFRYDYNILNFGASYGITDRLAAGIDIPYYYAHNKVKASLDSSGATVGVSTGPGAPPCNTQFLSLLCPNSRRFTTEDVQQLLRSRF